MVEGERGERIGRSADVQPSELDGGEASLNANEPGKGYTERGLREGEQLRGNGG